MYLVTSLLSVLFNYLCSKPRINIKNVFSVFFIMNIHHQVWDKTGTNHALPLYTIGVSDACTEWPVNFQSNKSHQIAYMK